MLQKVQFVAAIIHQPDLLILDEPFSGLDPVSVAAAARPDPRRASPRRDDPVLHARHAAGRRDLRARGDDPPRAQGAGRSRGGDSAAVRSAHDPVRAARPGGRPDAVLRRCPRWSGSGRPADGCRDPPRRRDRSGPAMQRDRDGDRAGPHRARARPRLEDVFIGIVSDGASTAETAQELRADLQGIGREGAAV